MSFDSFKKKWTGKRVDYDKVFLYQCVDLIKQYLYESFKIMSGAWGNAIDYAKSSSPIRKWFNKISGTSPKKGDIVVFKGGVYGHIGISTGRNKSTSVEVLEQNGSTGNGYGTGGDVIRTRYIAKSRIAAILRRKVKPNPLPTHIVVKKGWGLSNVAKAAKFKDWFSPTRWAAISSLNRHGLNWRKFNSSLKPGQKVRVRKNG